MYRELKTSLARKLGTDGECHRITGRFINGRSYTWHGDKLVQIGVVIA